MIKKIIIMMSLFFMGCGTIAQVPEINEDAFQIELRYRENLPIIYTTVNGIRGVFLIDTGASMSVIDYTLKDHFKYTTKGAAEKFSGIGGSRGGFAASDIDVRYKGRKLDINFKAIEMRGLRLNLGVVGIIGADYLKKNDLRVDFKNNVINVLVHED